jgi:hypothetical protein
MPMSQGWITAMTMPRVGLRKVNQSKDSKQAVVKDEST